MANLLTGLILCGLLGMIGQGARAVVGLASPSGQGPGAAVQQAPFNAAYLVLSLIIGFIAGVLAGLALNLPTTDGTAPDRETVLGLIAAGYAGTDFIENTFAKLLPSVGAAPAEATRVSAATPGATVAGPAQASEGMVKSLTDTIQNLSAHVAVTSAANLAASPSGTVAPLDLSGALHKILPNLDNASWLPVLSEAFKKFDLDSPWRIAAAMGQFVAEVGADFSEIRESMKYSAERLREVFPNEIPDLATAQKYAGNEEATANLVYAHKEGNGPNESGDGYRFRGGGLCHTNPSIA